MVEKDTNYTQSGWNFECNKSGIWCAFAGCVDTVCSSGLKIKRNKKIYNYGVDTAEYMGIMEWRVKKLSISIL